MYFAPVNTLLKFHNRRCWLAELQKRLQQEVGSRKEKVGLIFFQTILGSVEVFISMININKTGMQKGKINTNLNKKFLLGYK